MAQWYGKVKGGGGGGGGGGSMGGGKKHTQKACRSDHKSQ